MSQAYACRIKQSNFDAIASENPKFNLEELQMWLDIHGDGYFIRDEEHKPMDCQYMDLLVFDTIYRFDGFRSDQMFHPIRFKKKETQDE